MGVLTKCTSCNTDWSDCDILSEGQCASCLRAELKSLHRKQDAGVAALREAVEGGRAATAVVTIPIWLDELRWAIVAELDSRDELIQAAKAGGDDV